jgi:hypothetical protein
MRQERSVQVYAIEYMDDLDKMDWGEMDWVKRDRHVPPTTFVRTVNLKFGSHGSR